MGISSIGSISGRRTKRRGSSVVDRLPNELGDVDHEIRLGLVGIRWPAHLSDAYAYDVVQPPISFVVAEVEY